MPCTRGEFDARKSVDVVRYMLTAIAIAQRTNCFRHTASMPTEGNTPMDVRAKWDGGRRYICPA
jgi:hypothetical protein